MTWMQKALIEQYGCKESTARYTEARLAMRFGSLSNAFDEDIAEEYKYVLLDEKNGFTGHLEELAQSFGL